MEILISLSRGVTAEVWKKMNPAQRAKYIKKYPNSKYATELKDKIKSNRQAKAAKFKVTKDSTKKATSALNKKLSKDEKKIVEQFLGKPTRSKKVLKTVTKAATVAALALGAGALFGAGAAGPVGILAASFISKRLQKMGASMQEALAASSDPMSQFTQEFAEYMASLSEEDLQKIKEKAEEKA